MSNALQNYEAEVESNIGSGLVGGFSTSTYNYPLDNAMDPGTILAVAELSAKVLSVIAKYYWDVKNAKADIERLSNEIRSFHDILQKVQKLVQSFGATRLPISVSLAEAVKQSLLDITMLEDKLNPGKGGRVMKRVGLRALKWPLTKKEVDDYVAKLERYKTTLGLALNADQT